MSDKGSKASKKANEKISKLVSKLNSAIESVKEKDILFTEVDGVRKLATNCFQFFLEHGALDENAHLHKPKHRSSRSHSAGPDRRQNVRTTPWSEVLDENEHLHKPKHKSPRPHSASPNRRQNVRTTPGSAGSADKRPKSATRTGIKDAGPTPGSVGGRSRSKTRTHIKDEPQPLFCDDVTVTSKFEDDQTRDRDNKCIAELEDPNKYLTYQVDLAEKEKSETSRKCKHKDGLQEKSDKDLQQLKTVISNLQSDIVEHKQTNATLSNRLEVLREEKLELEERMRSPQVVSDPRNCQNCRKCRNEISDLKRDRLSEAAGNEPRENNPNIADLSDMNRPTSLADKFNSLYTDEYTNAMDVIEGSMDEAGAVHVMLEWLKTCYNWCEQLAREQRDLLTTESIGFMKKYHGQKIDFVVSENCLIHVKEFQKKIADDTLTAVREICYVKSVTQENLIDNSYIVKYIQKCSELCWRMQITDPPLCLKFDVKNGENLDKTLYTAFTKNGSRIEYLVWPSLFLHKSGPMMAKGVAQGTEH